MVHGTCRGDGVCARFRGSRLSGDKFHKVAGYNLTKTVNIGDSIEFGVDMQSPKNSGSYSTNWTLQVGGQKFCTVSLTIVVK